ncbi:hypothetical protein EUBDOL_01361 [Amedibacillus dolichus DSM 3991]|uniref:Uncharacterized protein n=1 Tax=Amedibacillus dolichus DSM 3991 TaxID=428127 RepID=A8RCE1_9FIRM|nr:hypothetical protein EUBDOL_01361 [Amedibacillus dolichus DSM 3991]
MVNIIPLTVIYASTYYSFVIVFYDKLQYLQTAMDWKYAMQDI